MKKFIYSLTVALAAGVAANAAAPTAQMQQLAKSDLQMAQMSQIAPQPMQLNRISPVKNQVKQRASSAEDFVGVYEWAGGNMLQSVVMPNKGIVTISIDPSDSSIIIIEGLADNGNALEGYFDSATGRLYIPNQYYWTNSYYNDDVWFMNYIFQYVGDDDFDIVRNDNNFFFTLQNGILVAGDEIFNAQKFNERGYTNEELKNLCIGGQAMPANQSGWFWLCYGITGEPFVEFDFIEDEWTKLGVTEFTDPWFPILWEETPTYEVPLYCNKANPTEFLLYDPYGYGGAEENPYVYFGINIRPDEPGFVIFDLADEECVPFKPFIRSITIDFREADEDPELPVNFYCLNWEGTQFYINEAVTEDIIIYADQYSMPLSNFNTRTRTLEVWNSVFTEGVNTNWYSWNNYQDYYGEIVLPENWQDAVETVLGENTEAAPVYYNLQGVRVNNPEKGQLLIVKQGNKTSKQVIR